MNKPIHVIITDDKELFRRTLKAALESYNIQVIAEAGNGLELIQCIHNYKPDVVLLDLEMPVMNGKETMQWLNKNRPEANVIITSQYDEQAIIDEYISWGAKGYFIKGDSLDELVRGIRLVKEGGKFITYTSQNRKIKFTNRQKEIINLVADGKTQKDIADELKLTRNGVHKQQKQIIKMLGFKELTSLKKQIYKLGLDFIRRPGK